MDTQLKRGILDICVLSALLRQDSYGYQIVKDISPYMTISESTLYPILRRLETAGFLATYSVAHNSRLRKYYSITQLGIARIAEFLTEWESIQKLYSFIKGEYDREQT